MNSQELLQQQVELQDRKIEAMQKENQEIKAKNKILEIKVREYAKTKLNHLITDLGRDAQNLVDEAGMNDLIAINIWSADVTNDLCSAVLALTYGKSALTEENPALRFSAKDAQYGVLHSVFSNVDAIPQKVLEYLDI